MRRILGLLVPLMGLALVGWALAASAQEKPAEQGEQKPAESAPASPSAESSKPEAPAAEQKTAEAKPEAKKEEGEKKEEGAKKDEGEKKEGEKKEEEKKETPKTHTVEAEPFKVELSLDGVFEAQKMAPIRLDAEEWSQFEVLKAVEHGATVKQGDLLVTLDMEKIDRALSDLRDSLKLKEYSIRVAELTLEAAQKLAPLELAAKQLSKQYGDEDLKTYLETDKPYLVKSADFSVKTTKDYLAYAQEELKQLEKMYKADELTEETEEIILKRARDSLERVQFSLEGTQINRDQTVDLLMPRQETALKQAVQQLDIEVKRAQAVQPLNLEKAKFELEQERLERTRGQERLTKLTADRETMLIKAPIGGIVYYGECDRGEWSGFSTAEPQLRAGGNLSNHSVFMTIVNPRPLQVRVTVPEKELHQTRANVKGKATAIALPDVKLDAIVGSVDAVPHGSSYQAVVTVALGPEAEAIMPGMKCNVKLVTYEKKDALTVPVAAVETDKQNEDLKYVHLTDDKGESKKTAVKVGKKTDEKYEILEGVKAGDKVLAEAPKK